LKGKLPTVDTPTAKDKMTINNIDCAAQQVSSDNQEDNFDDEILKEILAE